MTPIKGKVLIQFKCGYTHTVTFISKEGVVFAMRQQFRAVVFELEE